MANIGQLYGVEKQQIENLNWAMAQMSSEGQDETILLFPKEDRCLGLVKPSLADAEEQNFLKAEKIGSAILYLADEKAKYIGKTGTNWNESYNGHDYNIIVEVVRID